MAHARILVVEDEPDVAQLERSVLERSDYEVEVAHTGEQALKTVQSYKPDVVILDIGLPDISGLDVCTTISDSYDAFILMVSGHSREQDVLTGLGLGADDYITKPFSPNELVARVASFLRRRERYRTPHADGGEVAVGKGRLVRDFQALTYDGKSVPLTVLEFNLLMFLAEAEGRLLTRAQILEHVWHDTSGIPTRTVDIHVAALRKKMEEIGEPARIATVRGMGYRLDK